MTVIAQSMAYQRYEATPADNLLLDWNFDPGESTNLSTPVAGVLNCSRFWVPQTITIANIWTMLMTAGAGATALANCYVGVYGNPSAGVFNLLGSSTDQSTAWATLTANMSIAAVTVAAGQSLTVPGGSGSYVYVGRLVGTQSTTAVQFGSRAQNNANVANVGMVLSGGGWTANALPRSFTTGTALTALPSTVTPLSGSVGVDYWCAVT
jgi:hypothetical protein